MKTFIKTLMKFLVVAFALSFLNLHAQNAGDGDYFAKIKKGGKYGFINQKGEIIIKSQYDDANDFSDGLAAVKQGELWGAIDKSNTMVIKPQFSESFSFKKGRAAVSRTGKTGFDVINKTGAKVLHTENYFVFFNGFADGIEPVTNPTTQKVGLLNLKGIMLADANYDEVRAFSEGMAVVKKGGLYGFIDKSGKLVIQPTYNDASSFNNGLAVVKAGLRSGILNKAGKFVLPIGSYSNVFGYVDGMIRVAKKTKDGQSKMGFVDRAGKLVVPTTYDEAGDFHEGKAFVIKDGKYGYIDTTGKVVIPFQFDNSGEFSEGMASINMDGKYGFIDETGKVVIKPDYESALPFNDGYTVVGKDGMFGILDKSGKMTVNAKYSEITPLPGDGFKVASTAGTYGLIAHNDKVLLPMQYEEIGIFSK
jgi:hypothetical protein